MAVYELFHPQQLTERDAAVVCSVNPCAVCAQCSEIDVLRLLLRCPQCIGIPKHLQDDEVTIYTTCANMLTSISDAAELNSC